MITEQMCAELLLDVSVFLIYRKFLIKYDKNSFSTYIFYYKMSIGTFTYEGTSTVKKCDNNVHIYNVHSALYKWLVLFFE